MLAFLLLSHSLRQPVQLPPRTFDVALQLLLLRAVHRRHGFREPPPGAMQNGNRHFQIARDLGRHRFRCRWLLRLQKQVGFGEDALPDHA
jgi:hypothetical protein